MRTFIILLLSSLLSLQASAQEDTRLMLGNIDTRQTQSVNIQDILLNPTLTCIDTSNKVLFYTLLITTANGNLLGPYQGRGADLSPEILTALRENINNSGNIIFDGIKMVDAKGNVLPPAKLELKFPQ